MIQKITLQILLVSKQYILVLNFGKNVQKGGVKAVWIFSLKKTSIFGKTVAPNKNSLSGGTVVIIG